MKEEERCGDISMIKATPCPEVAMNVNISFRDEHVNNVIALTYSQGTIPHFSSLSVKIPIHRRLPVLAIAF